jgi:hypothetical protein
MSVLSYPARIKQAVQFNLDQHPTETFVPFLVIVPQTYSGQFVRFVHPFNGKSAVAKVVKKEGDQFITNPELADVIGIQSTVAQVFIEEVY